MVRETSLPGATVSCIARKHGTSPSMLFQGRRALEDGALPADDGVEGVVPKSEMKKFEERVRRLDPAPGLAYAVSA
jgi:transposase